METLNRHNWFPICTFILGLPEETREDFPQSLDLLFALKDAKWCVIPTLFVPLPSPYDEFLALTNGGKGSIGSDGHAALWRVEESITLTADMQGDRQEALGTFRVTYNSWLPWRRFFLRTLLDNWRGSLGRSIAEIWRRSSARPIP